VSAPAAAPEDAKPSPVGPAETKVGQALPPANPEPAPSTPVAKAERGPVRPGVPQEVMFTSSPAGATATLDGNPSMACSTPCSLRAAQGRHSLSLVLPGHQIERRDFTVGAGPLELTPVVLKAVGGILMLTSVPDHAAISVNGKRIDQVTPAQIPLALGVYSIMIEKDGRQATEKVEIKDGMTTRKIILGQ
jgi:hypothetical protein